MKWTFLRFRHYLVLGAIVLFLGTSVAPSLELTRAEGITPDVHAPLSIVDGPMPDDPVNDPPALPSAQVDIDRGIGCALGVTPVAFLEQGGGAGVDYPNTPLSPVHGQFHDDGFIDIGVPVVDGGQENEVSVGDRIVIYTVMTNNSNNDDLLSVIRPECFNAMPVDGTELIIPEIEIRLAKTDDPDDMGTPIGSAVTAVDWPGEEGIIPPNGQTSVFTLFSWEVPPELNGLLERFRFIVDVNVTCDDPDVGGNLCTETRSRVQRYPDVANQIFAPPGVDTTNFADYYGTCSDPSDRDTCRDPLIEIVGARADVSVTVNGGSSDIVVAPFTDVEYAITLTSQGSGLDALRSLDDGDGLGVGNIPECGIESGNWTLDGGGAIDASSIDGVGDGLEVGESITCTFTREITPAITNDDDEFRLNGILRLFNQDNSGGLESQVNVVAPSVLVTQASIDIVKQIIDPDTDTPLPGDTEFAVGDTITYRITVTNTGQNDLENLLVIDSLTGPVTGFGGVLTVDGEDSTRSARVQYTVTANDARPLPNTVTVTANPVGAPISFEVSDSAVATALIAADDLSVTLILQQVQQLGAPTPVAFDGTDATLPRPGAVLFYQVQYCNLGQVPYRDLRYINGTPDLIDTPQEFVDTVLTDGEFAPNCYIDNTDFQFTVPLPTEDDYIDPVINTINVRAISQTGAFLFAEDTLITNVINENIEISAERYSLLTGQTLTESDAALRGETLYYHVDIQNNSGTCLSGVEIRNYVRDPITGNLNPGSPFLIPDAAIDWGSGTPGRLEPDNPSGSDDEATSRSVPDGNRISFTVTGSTPDPLTRVFEVFADTSCSGATLPEPLIDRSSVFTDISNVQLNTFIQVFDNVADPTRTNALDFGLLLDVSEYVFEYNATNTGVTFEIDQLTYCVIAQPGGACNEVAFPGGPDNLPNFFNPTGDNSFLPFENRSDVSAPIDVVTEGDGAFGPELQIQVILRGVEGGSNITVRSLETFPLLGDDLVGEIQVDLNRDGEPDPELLLVRGDGPVPIQYQFQNQTGGQIDDIVVYNLTETGTGAGFDTVPLAGFDNTEYELCPEDQTLLLDGETVSGTCNFTYRSYLPGGGFNIQILVVGRRVTDDALVFGFDTLGVTEVEHIEVEKLAFPTVAAIGQEVTFTITVSNNSRYQRLEFFLEDGIEDVLSTTLLEGNLPTLADFVGDIEDTGGSIILNVAPSAEQPAEMVAVVTVRPDGTGLVSITNTVTMTATSALPSLPPDPVTEVEVGNVVSATDEVSILLSCPINLEGISGVYVNSGLYDIASPPLPEDIAFITQDELDQIIARQDSLPFINSDVENFIQGNPLTFPEQELITPTVGEGQLLILDYPNRGGIDIFVSDVDDERFLLEEGRDVYGDIQWPDPAYPGLLRPGESFRVVMPIWIRPNDLQSNAPIQTFTWDVNIALGTGSGETLPPDADVQVPPGCETFDLFWFFDYEHPIQVEKSTLGEIDLVPGNDIQYDVEFTAISEYVDFFIQRVDDSVLNDNLDFLITGDGGLESGPGAIDPGGGGRIERLDSEGNNQNVYTVTAADATTGITNVANVTAYIPIDLPASAYPQPWQDAGLTTVIGSGNTVVGEDSIEVQSDTPLIVTLEAGVETVSVGGRFDINVVVSNISTALSINNVTVLSTDQEFVDGLVLASGGVTNGTLTLPPVPDGTVSYLVTDPYYRVPFDFVGDELTICADATGFLSDAENSPVIAEQACLTVAVEPPPITVVKQVYENKIDDACSQLVPFIEAEEPTDRVFTVEPLQSVFFEVEISNTSEGDSFTINSFEDIVNDTDGTDLSAALDAEFLVVTGGTREIGPGQTFSPCIPYIIPADAVALPQLINSVTLNAQIGESTFQITDDVQIDVEDPNINISKSTTQNIGFPGDTVQYTVVIRNQSAEATILIDEFYDTLIAPRRDNASYITSCETDYSPGNDLSQSTSCDPSVTSVPLDDERWNWPLTEVGVIPPLASATLIYEYAVLPSDPDPLINDAGVSAKLYGTVNDVVNWDDPVQNEAGTEDLLAQDATRAAIAITDSQLIVRKDAVPGAVIAGGTASYNIVITNIGEVPVTNIEIIDCYPTVSAPCNLNEDPFDVNGDPNPAFGGEVLTSELVPQSNALTLLPSQSVRIPSSAIVLPSLADVEATPDFDPFINTVYVTGLVQIDESGSTLPVATATNSAVVDILIPGIQVEKTTDDATYSVGETVTYDVSILNTGEQPLLINSVQDIVPGSGGNPVPVTGFTDCEDGTPFQLGLDTIEPAASICSSIDIQVPVPPAGESEFVNTIRVEGEIVIEGGDNIPISDNASEVIDVRSTGLVVTKLAFASQADADNPNASPITQVQDGEDVFYRITITNGGTIALSTVRIDDSLDAFNGGSTLEFNDFTGVGNNDALLDPTEEVSLTYSYSADFGDANQSGDLTNSVSIVGVEDPDGGLTESRTTSYTINIEPVNLDVTKVACVEVEDGVPPTFPDCVLPTTFAQPGDNVWYQVVITNNSAQLIETISAVDSRDNAALQTEFAIAGNWDGGIVGQLAACTGDPCPSATFTYRSASVIPSGESSVTNTIDVAAVANSANIDAQASATITIVTGDLLVTITEQNNRTEATAGTLLTFTVTVTNLSVTEDLNNVSVVLPLLDAAPRTVGTLAAGATSSAETYTYTVQPDDTTIEFIAQASGTLGVSGITVNDTDSFAVTRVVAGFSGAKVGDVTTAVIGDTIMYTITVRNTSGGSLEITNLSVQDSLIPEVATRFPATLAAGQTVTEMFAYEVQGNEGNPIVNELLVTGEIEGEGFVFDDSWEVFIPGGETGEILVTNRVSETSVDVGDTVTFTYEVCNLSESAQMTNVTLTDNDGALTLSTTTLDAGACANAFRQVTATAGDVPELSRTVTGTGDINADTLTQSVTRTVEVVDTTGAGDLRFEVIPSAATVTIGDQLGLTFIVGNIGTESLTIDSFIDTNGFYDTFTPSPVGTNLGPGESLTFEGTTGPIDVTVSSPDPIVNSWTVRATDDNSNNFEVTDSISIPIVDSPDVELILSFEADVEEVLAGGTVNYTYTVRNNSAQVQTAQLTVTGNECAAFTEGGEALWSGSGQEILPGATATATATCVVPLEPTGVTIDHTVNAFALPDAVTVVDSIDIATPIASAVGELAVEVLETQPATLQVGSTVNFVFRISNTSSTSPLTDITFETTLTRLDSSTTDACDDPVYRDAENNGDNVTFDGTLAANNDVFVFCEYTVDDDDFDSVTFEARVSAAGVDDATDNATFNVIDASFTVDFSIVGGNTQVSIGDSLSFIATLRNTGQSPLTLPTFVTSNPAIVSDVAQAGTDYGDLGSNEALYDIFEDLCAFPLEPDDTCTVSGDNAAVAPLLTYTVPANAPTALTVTFGVMLEDTNTGFDVPMVTRTLQLTVASTSGSMSITNFLVGFTTPVAVGDTSTVTANLQNTGTSTIQLTSVTLEVVEDTGQQASVPNTNGDVALMSAPRQDTTDDGTCVAPTPMNITFNGGQITLPYSFQAGVTLNLSLPVTLTSDPDCYQGIVWIIRANGTNQQTAVAVNASALLRLTTEQDPFQQITGGGDGEALDPNALDPEVTKLLEPEVVFPSESGVFTITVRNPSTSDMVINFIDPIAASFTVDSATSTLGTATVDGIAEVPGVEVSVLGVTLGPGASMTVTINFTVGADVEIPSLITNTACAANGTRPEVCASVEVPVGGTADGSLPTTGIGSLEPSVLEEEIGMGLPGETGDLIAPILWR